MKKKHRKKRKNPLTRKTSSGVYVINYDIPCLVCGQFPTVTMAEDNYNTELCGPCCFGEAICINPEEW